ncbi:MAG: YggS family pyridoxal phosphate-dependent enzyme [Chitinophagaceae bacterium]
MNQAEFNALKNQLTEQQTTLIAVSKTKPAEAIQTLYDWGQRDFGENKVQEMCDKQAQLPADIRWHQIGHLQSNKVKYIAPFVALIHSVDSLKLMQEINKQAEKCHRVIPVLLQMHIATEETKFGLDNKELIELIEYYLNGSFPHVEIHGLMGMASLTEEEEQVKQEFSALHELFIFCKNSYFLNRPEFNTLSMGMSGDFALAIACGSNMVRIGSLLFGQRN